MPDYPIVDIHTHLFRTPAVGRMAFTAHNPVIEYSGVPEDHIAGHKDAGVSYSASMVVTPMIEMRQRALLERGDYGTPVWEENSGLKLDQKLLTRMDHNNAWGSWVGQKYPEIVPFIMIDPRLIAGDTLASYVQNRWDEGARGVKLLASRTHHHGSDRRLFPMFDFMQSINMPLFAMSGGGYGRGQNNPVTGDAWGRPRQFRTMLENFPRLNVILAHAMGGYNNTYGDLLDLTDNFPNVYVDTTVVTPKVTEHPELAMDLAKMVKRIGAEHIAFGTNFPLTEVNHDRKHGIDIWLNLPLLSDAEKQMILSSNGLKLIHGSVPIGVGNTFPNGDPVPSEFMNGGGWG